VTKWRLVVGFFAVVIILANFGVLGFHEPRDPLYSIVMIVGLAIITCICDAVQALKGSRNG
jgi:hypothetical protein